MTMLSPLDLDLRVAAHQEDLMCEAAAERLAAQLPPRSSWVRASLAAALYALAERLDQHQAAAAQRGRAQSLSRPRAVA